MKGRMWIALAVALLTAVPGGVLASHLVAGNPETVVTGHTVLASNIFVADEFPTDFAAIAGFAFAQRRNECVVWFNGVVIFDGTLGPTGLDWDSDNNPATNPPGIDDGAQANDNLLDPCGKIVINFLIFAVEAGDCDPRGAVSAEFVRDLSFTDPNAIVHPVAEIVYTCFHDGLLDDVVDGVLGGVPGDVPDSPEDGGDSADPGNDEGNEPLLSDGQNDNLISGFLLNATFQEYVWVTQTHATITDPLLDDGICATPNSEGDIENFCVYNWSLMVDTCNDDVINNSRNSRSTSSSGSKCTDGGGEEFFQDDDDGDGDYADPGEEIGPRFDDTARSLTAHTAPPATCDEIRDGNSNHASLDGICVDENTDGVAHPDNHREDKSADIPDSSDDDPTPDLNETDYDPEEDHLTAQVDIYVSQEDCDPLTPSDETIVGQLFCTVLAQGDLTALVVNHPGCVLSDDAAIGSPSPGDPNVSCWDPIKGPDDAAGTGEYDGLVQSLPYP